MAPAKKVKENPTKEVIFEMRQLLSYFGYM